MTSGGRKYLEYYSQLNDSAKKRYCDKLYSISLEVDDPYTFSTTGSDSVPNIEFPDIFNFLINTPSPYTKKELKAYKSLDGYKYLLAGWVSDVSIHLVAGGDEKMVLTGRVRHSQSVSASHLKPWVAAEKCGTITCSHCTCMAGLGEACSHIAALLFAVEVHNRLKDTSCTSQPCQWRSPTMQTVPYAPISDISFTAPTTKKKRLLEGKPSIPSQPVLKLPPPPSKEKRSNFFQDLSKTGKPVLLSVIPEYCERYMIDNSLFSLPLYSLYNPNATSLSYHDLLVKCEAIFSSLKLNGDQAKNIELSTRDQSKSKAWFRFKAGRITASKFKAVIHTDCTQPSVSLVKSICYPESFKFSTKATRWGCEHEKRAREEYFLKAARNHLNLTLTDRGLVVRPEYPYLGASPDGYIKCHCCGSGVVEIKCPFSCKDRCFIEATDDKSFCLEKADNDSLVLKRDHSYYYQVQLQMKMCDVNFCDLVVWRNDELVINRIERDNHFLETAIDKAIKFFKYCLLPELVGKWYTRPLPAPTMPTPQQPSTSHSLDNSDNHSDEEKMWCYCRKPESRNMIMCESDNCKIVWYHFKCLKITIAPKKKWFCPDCRKEIATSAKVGKRKQASITISTS